MFQHKLLLPKRQQKYNAVPQHSALLAVAIFAWKEILLPIQMMKRFGLRRIVLMNAEMCPSLIPSNKTNAPNTYNRRSAINMWVVQGHAAKSSVSGKTLSNAIVVYSLNARNVAMARSRKNFGNPGIVTAPRQMPTKGIAMKRQ